MASYLNRVNNFLQNNQVSNQVSETALAGPHTYENILANEMNKCLMLDGLEKSLINDLTKPNKLRTMSDKQKQSLMMDIDTVLCNSRDFVFKAAELSSKDGFMQKVLNKLTDETQIVQSESGEVYHSEINEEVRASLSKLLRAQINDKTRR